MSKAPFPGRLIAVVALNAALAGVLIWTASKWIGGKERREYGEDPILLKLPAVPDLRRPALEVVALRKEVTYSAGIEFAIKNISDVPVWVVRPVDGSDYGIRAPKCLIMIWDADGKRADPPLPIRCGNMNSLAPDDFVRLEPGATLPVQRFMIHPGTAIPEGEYTIQCVYGTEGPYGFWLGFPKFHTPEILRRIDQVPKGTFLSAPMRVRVRK